MAESSKMHRAYRKRIKKRIKLMDWAACVLVMLILALVFGFLATVIGFEHLLKPLPPAIAAFSQDVREFREALAKAERNIKDLQAGALPAVVRDGGIQNNEAVLSESLRLTAGHLDELAKSVYANQDKILGSYLNERRIVLVLSGLFVAYLVKLFAGLYKYNAYLKAHYASILDALDLSVIDQGGDERFDLARFQQLVAMLSVKHLQIDHGASFLEGLVTRKHGGESSS